MAKVAYNLRDFVPAFLEADKKDGGVEVKEIRTYTQCQLEEGLFSMTYAKKNMGDFEPIGNWRFGTWQLPEESCSYIVFMSGKVNTWNSEKPEQPKGTIKFVKNGTFIIHLKNTHFKNSAGCLDDGRGKDGQRRIPRYISFETSFGKLTNPTDKYSDCRTEDCPDFTSDYPFELVVADNYVKITGQEFRGCQSLENGSVAPVYSAREVIIKKTGSEALSLVLANAVLRVFQR